MFKQMVMMTALTTSMKNAPRRRARAPGSPAHTVTEEQRHAAKGDRVDQIEREHVTFRRSGS